MRTPRPRALLPLLAAGLAAGCAAAVGVHAAAAVRPLAAGRAPAASAPSSPPAAGPSPADAPLPAVTPYAVAADEVAPDAKRLAADVALRLTTYDAGTSAARLASAVTADPPRAAALAVAAAPLVHPDRSSRGTVVYPQLGGLTADRASVMVVVRQQLDGGAAQTRTLDVRLVRTGAGWALDALASAGGEPVAPAGAQTPEATAVLADPRITLPDSARWDIAAGGVSPTLLRLMERLADHAGPYAVTVLHTGHPYDVFGTTHESDHTAGRAVDIRLLGGTPVVGQRQSGSLAERTVAWLLAQPEVSQVGSPWDLDGPSSRRSFTNEVHLDHLHVAVAS